MATRSVTVLLRFVAVYLFILNRGEWDNDTLSIISFIIKRKKSLIHNNIFFAFFPFTSKLLQAQTPSSLSSYG